MSTRKRITELTVAELRIQLSKRGVDTAGDRPALISKLKKVLQEESAKASATPLKPGAAPAKPAAAPVAAKPTGTATQIAEVSSSAALPVKKLKTEDEGTTERKTSSDGVEAKVGGITSVSSVSDQTKPIVSNLASEEPMDTTPPVETSSSSASVSSSGNTECAPSLGSETGTSVAVVSHVAASTISVTASGSITSKVLTATTASIAATATATLVTQTPAVDGGSVAAVQTHPESVARDAVAATTESSLVQPNVDEGAKSTTSVLGAESVVASVAAENVTAEKPSDVPAVALAGDAGTTAGAADKEASSDVAVAKVAVAEGVAEVAAKVAPVAKQASAGVAKKPESLPVVAAPIPAKPTIPSNISAAPLRGPAPLRGQTPAKKATSAGGATAVTPARTTAPPKAASSAAGVVRVAAPSKAATPVAKSPVAPVRASAPVGSTAAAQTKAQIPPAVTQTVAPAKPVCTVKPAAPTAAPTTAQAKVTTTVANSEAPKAPATSAAVEIQPTTTEAAVAATTPAQVAPLAVGTSSVDQEHLPTAAVSSTVDASATQSASIAAPVVTIKTEPGIADEPSASLPETENVKTVVKKEKVTAAMDLTEVDAIQVDSSSESSPETADAQTTSTSLPKTAATNKTTLESAMAAGGHSLWVSGLTSSFRAADLKVMFGKYGKVIAAKVVTSAKSPGSKCFGFVLMNSAEEVEEAIKGLNNTEVQGQKITVEKDQQKRAILQPSSSSAIPASTTLWVNGLSTNTKAADLKMLFMKHGKVTGAKVVTSAKNPGSKCYGLVTLSSVEEADVCIQHLNKTEFHGRIISLEKAKADVKTQTKMAVTLPASSESNSEEKKEDAKPKAREAEKPKEPEKSKSDHSKELKKDENILSLEKIREERERERRMQHERIQRENERRRMRELERERRLQREEAEKLAREREKLRVEKLRLERERMEAERARVQLERERQRREHEREREREMERMERQRREARAAQSTAYGVGRNDIKRSSSNEGGYWQPAKRPLLDDHSTSPSYNAYDVHSTGSFYDKPPSGQYGASDRRVREPEKTGAAIPSLWNSYRSHERANEPPQRTAAIEQPSFSNTSEWNRGTGVSQWSSTTYRGNEQSSYPMTGTGIDSSRQYVSSAAPSNPYMNQPSGQSYKWY